MTVINVVRTWGDELALAAQRIDEAGEALTTLKATPGALDDTLRALGDGSTWDDPFEAARDLAIQGNRGLWDSWNAAEASHSILGRAISKHPGGEGVTELRRAQSLMEDASGDLGNWIARGGSGASFDAIEHVVRLRLTEAAELAAQVQPHA